MKRAAHELPERAQKCAPRRRSLRHSRLSTETPTIARAPELTTRTNVVALKWHCGIATRLAGIAPCDARCDTPARTTLTQQIGWEWHVTLALGAT